MLFSGRSASDKSELIDGMAENFVAIDFVAIDKVFFEVGLIWSRLSRVQLPLCPPTYNVFLKDQNHNRSFRLIEDWCYWSQHLESVQYAIKGGGGGGWVRR